MTKKYWNRKNRKGKSFFTLIGVGCLMLLMTACAAEPVEVEVIKEVTVEVPVEVEVEKEVEVVKEVEVETIKEVEVTRIVEVDTSSGEMMEPTVMTTNLQFVTHATAGLVEQDVYIVKDGLAEGEVMRATLEELEDPAVLSQTVYRSAELKEHDPFGAFDKPLGPVVAGEQLDFTMSEWLAATGTGTYTVQENNASVTVEFEKLIPNGVYTMWCTRTTLPPEPVISNVACGEWDGSENIFVADADGRGSLTFSMRALMEPTEERLSLMALAYHSDGQTFGPFPGDFGSQTHVQALAVLPPPGDEAWQVVDQ